jgi:hypothetical protein
VLVPLRAAERTISTSGSFAEGPRPLRLQFPGEGVRGQRFVSSFEAVSSSPFT